jgi:membrane protein
MAIRFHRAMGRTSPWQLGGLTVIDLAGRVWREVNNDEILDRAAALSFYALFAFFPGLLFLVALLGFLPVRGLLHVFFAYLGRVLPGDSLSLIQHTLREVVQNSHRGLLSLGALTALWTASSGMASLMTTMNIAYHVTDSRPWWVRRGIAILLTVGFSVLLLAALTLMVFGPKLGNLLAGWLGLEPMFAAAWNVASVVLPVGFVLVGIALVYYFAPALEQKWRWITPGSALATALWLAVSFVLRLYVTSFSNYNATYGSLGGAILFLLWLYLTGMVLMLGAEVNSEIENAAALQGNPEAKAAGQRAA